MDNSGDEEFSRDFATQGNNQGTEKEIPIEENLIAVLLLSEEAPSLHRRKCQLDLHALPHDYTAQP